MLLNGKLETEWPDSYRAVGPHISPRSNTSKSKCMFKATSGNPRPGGFAEYAILEADLAIHIPAAVTSEQAAGFPLCSLTAAQVSHYP